MLDEKQGICLLSAKTEISPHTFIITTANYTSWKIKEAEKAKKNRLQGF